MSRHTLLTFWSDADSAWVADAPDLNSCSAFGDTPQEAVAELTVAMEARLAAARMAGHTLPRPRFHARHEAAG